MAIPNLWRCFQVENNISWRHWVRLISVLSIVSEHEGGVALTEDIRRGLGLKPYEFEAAIQDLKFYELLQIIPDEDLESEILSITNKGLEYYKSLLID